MKTLITGFGLTMMLLISSMIQLNITNNSSREFELASSVNNAMIETQRQYLYTSSINSSDAYQKAFIDALKNYITSDSEITVNFYSSDVTLGLLDVEVAEEYYQNGKDATITCRRTNIIDEYEEISSLDVLQNAHLITYDIDENISLNLTGIVKGKTDDHANIVYHIKEDDTQQVRIQILIGSISEVSISDESIDYEIEEGYLTFTLSNITENTIIHIR